MGLNQYTTTGGKLVEGVLFLNKAAYFYGGAGVLLDPDNDSGLRAVVDDTIELFIANSVEFTWTTNTMTMAATSKIVGQGGNISTFIPNGNPQPLNGAGQSTITEYLTKWTTTAADSASLDDGAAIGQLKKILMVADGGDGTLTPNNFKDGASIVFADAGDFVVLMWESTGWTVVDSGNTVDGVTEPTTI